MLCCKKVVSVQSIFRCRTPPNTDEVPLALPEGCSRSSSHCSQGRWAEEREVEGLPIFRRVVLFKLKHSHYNGDTHTHLKKNQGVLNWGVFQLPVRKDSVHLGFNLPKHAACCGKFGVFHGRWIGPAWKPDLSWTWSGEIFPVTPASGDRRQKELMRIPMEERKEGRKKGFPPPNHPADL